MHAAQKQHVEMPLRVHARFLEADLFARTYCRNNPKKVMTSPALLSLLFACVCVSLAVRVECFSHQWDERGNACNARRTCAGRQALAVFPALLAVGSPRSHFLWASTQCGDYAES